MREPGGVHSKVPGRRSLPRTKLVHSVGEVGVQARQCLVEDGVAGSSCKTELFKEVRGEGELSHKDPVAESRVDLESEENKESWEWEV